MGNPNAELVRRAFELFAAGDVERMQEEVWAEDIVWHIGGTSRVSGDHAGAAAILAMFAELGAASEGTFHTELQEVLADDQRGFSLQRATAQKGGVDFEIWTVLGYRFRDGKISEVWSFNFDQTISDQLLA